MEHKFPTRPRSHVLETQSVRFFEQSLPPDWTSEKSQHDYGVDLKVDIFEDGEATNLEFLVQLKASEISTAGDKERVTLKVTTYNLLWNKLQVVLIVKYVSVVNEAYWILLSDVPEPLQTQGTFTVNIPKENVLSNISWQYIQAYVRQVTRDKLEARRSRRPSEQEPSSGS